MNRCYEEYCLRHNFKRFDSEIMWAVDTEDDENYYWNFGYPPLNKKLQLVYENKTEKTYVKEV